ncbi:protein kinase domain-containing protein [Paraliomyxa miuraensis]|uniref:protein kinase domain-containing protein n=1 Tax=Paraliomyxa miuraensis TaxID=376150 RepID=UPI002257D17D|nr:protein kinase [Paraliomyxa miuraensis]MCX4243363.1 protein kinase [Paraliomyxa miuraensis]
MTNDEGAISGRIADRSIADLFQWLHESRGTGIARFRTALGTATVWFRDGELIDADMGRFHLDAAVLRLMRIQDGEYEVEFTAIQRRHAIKASTPVLLAEARQRAPRIGPTKSPTGAAAAVPVPRPKADSNARTLHDAKAVPRRPPSNDAASTTPTPSSTARGPSARRRLGWSPTGGGSAQGPEPAPSPPPTRPAQTPSGRFVPTPAPAPPERGQPRDDAPKKGRTGFLFGVSTPSSSGSDAEPTPASAAPATSAPTSPRTPRFGDVAVTDPASPADARPPSEPRRRRPRPAARRTVPFEPERSDRTLLRPGPVPPPPGQPVVLPPTSSDPIAIDSPPDEPPEEEATIRRSLAGSEPGRGSTAVLPPQAAPDLVDEVYSHPISVPTAPNFGPGGTWMLTGASGPSEPPPSDPTTEDTVSLNAADVVQARGGPSLSGHVKAGGTAHVGRYEVLLRLARGGMGTVYLCRVTGEGGFRRLFALKVVRDHLNANRTYVRMLLEEARIASRLSHPNIVSIIDIDTFAGQHYLVMEYVEGCTLSELLKAHPRERPPELIVPVVIDALTGLHAAHMLLGDDGSPKPVVHCDFSPQNMLVGINGTCRITDFGIAKAADALPEGPGRGKPGYLSPEQVRGLPVDPRSDVFAAGVVLWNALTGETLFDGETPEQILHQVVSRSVPKPSTVGLRPPACFDRICLRALERDPGQRYQSAEQMLMELRKVAIAQDLLAPSSEVGRWVQETFGAQLELRRQAAGLGPGPAVALALREAGPLGAIAARPPPGDRTDDTESIDGANASMTMMLRSEPAPAADPHPGADEGFGPRTRVVVIIAALTFIATAVITLFVRPDLLQGGIIDERGLYVDPNEPPPEIPYPLSTSGGLEPVVDDQTTGAPASADTMAPATTGTELEEETDTDGEGPTAPPPAGDATRDAPKGKPGKAKSTDEEPTPAPKAGKGKGKRKDAGVPTAPPPDLDELFRQPG